MATNSKTVSDRARIAAAFSMMATDPTQDGTDPLAVMQMAKPDDITAVAAARCESAVLTMHRIESLHVSEIVLITDDTPSQDGEEFSANISAVGRVSFASA